MMRTTALIAAGTLVAVPLATVLAASPATADTTKRGVCGPGNYEFQVDREDVFAFDDAANTRGTDTFRFKAVPAGGSSTCAAIITVR